MSYRSVHPFRIVGEVINWQGHSATQIRTTKEHLEQLKAQGVESLNDIPPDLQKKRETPASQKRD